LAGLYEWEDVGIAQPHQGGGVGLALGQLEGEDRRAVHTVLKYQVAVNLYDAGGDGYFGLGRLSFDTLGQRPSFHKQVHGLPLSLKGTPRQVAN
jgi:hypothetical protein